MDNNISSYKSELDHWISHIIDHSEDEREQIYETEKWLTGQLDKIQAVRHFKNKKAAVLSGQDSLTNYSDLIFDPEYRIIQYSGAFCYFIGSANSGKSLSLLDFIDECRHAELSSFMKLAKSFKRKYSFETIIVSYLKNHYKAIVEIEPKGDNGDFKMQISYYSSSQSSLNHISYYQSIMLKNLPGMSVFLFDHDLRFLVAGGKEKEKYGLKDEDFVGKTLSEAFSEKNRKRLYPFFKKALRGEICHGEIRNEQELYSVTTLPIKDEKEQTVVAALIIKNITKERLVEEQLRKGKFEAQKADEAKSIFLANISHEMRTPLNSIIGFLEQLGFTSLTPEQKKFHEIVNKSAHHLLHLVNEIVFLFKLGMGKVYIEKKPFDLHELCSEVHKQYALKALEKNIKFDFSLDENIPSTLKGDPYRLKQIIINLLDNAFKYTDAGSVELKCQLLHREKTKVHISLSVADTGLGISKEDMPNIFKIFEQAHRNKANVRDGAGLGLGICKKLVDLFDGEIFVKSKLGQGTVFTVNLPLKITKKKSEVLKQTVYKIEDGLLADYRILMADDDQFNRMLVESIFQKWELNYELAEDGQAALNKLNKENFDLVILDINMPHKNGIDVLKEIRNGQTVNGRDTVVLALTANAVKQDIDNFMEAGFNDYLLKPFLEHELYNKLCISLDLPVKSEDKSYVRNSVQDILDLDKISKSLLNIQSNQLLQKAELKEINTTCLNLIESLTEGIVAMNFELINEEVQNAIPFFEKLGFEDITFRLAEIQKLTQENEDSGLLLSDKIQEISPIFNSLADHVKSSFF